MGLILMESLRIRGVQCHMDVLRGRENNRESVTVATGDINLKQEKEWPSTYQKET